MAQNKAEYEYQVTTGNTADDAAPSVTPGGGRFGPAISGVVLTPAQTSVRVQFTTDVPAAPRVAVIRLGAVARQTQSFALGTAHDITVTGLTASTAYTTSISAKKSTGEASQAPGTNPFTTTA